MKRGKILDNSGEIIIVALVVVSIGSTFGIASVTMIVRVAVVVMSVRFDPWRSIELASGLQLAIMLQQHSSIAG